MRSLRGSLHTLDQWSGYYVDEVEMAAQLFDRDLASVASFEDSMDIVVALDPKGAEPPYLAFAVGIKSFAAARDAILRAGGNAASERAEEYQIKLARTRILQNGAFCLLAPSAGRAGGRVVCGRSQSEVEQLSPFMTKALPLRDFGSADLHVEWHVPPLVSSHAPRLAQALDSFRTAVPQFLALGEPGFDQALEAAAAGLSDEVLALSSDLDSVSLELRLSSDAISGTLSTRFRDTKSWSSRDFASQARHSRPAPPEFLRLPASSYAASYQTSGKAGGFSSIEDGLLRLLEGWLRHEGVEQAETEDWSKLLGDITSTGGLRVSAAGRFEVVPSTQKHAATVPRTSDPDREDWWVSEIPSFTLPKHLDNVLRDYTKNASRKAVSRLLRSLTASDSMKSNRPALDVKAVPVPRDLPAGSLAFELTVDRSLLSTKRGTPAGDAKFSLLVVPEADHCWLALAENGAKLVPLLLGVLQGAPSAPTLAGRDDLGAIRNGAHTSARFTSLLSLTHTWRGPFAKALGVPPITGLTDSDLAIQATKWRGNAPIVITTDIEKADQGSIVTTHLVIPKAAIEDGVRLATRVFLQ